MILCGIIHTVHSMTPTHMKRSSCRPDVVKYIMAALKPEFVYISVQRFSTFLHMFYNHFIYYAPAPVVEAGALGGHRHPSSVRPSVCLMSRTSAITRKPRGLGRRNFAQGYPRSHATPTPTSRSKGQKSRSRGGGILWRV